jgi:hypothetical protein
MPNIPHALLISGNACKYCVRFTIPLRSVDQPIFGLSTVVRLAKFQFSVNQYVPINSKTI